MSASASLPDIGAVLGPLLARVPHQQQPLLLALAERLGALTWRSFAEHADEGARRETFLACADLEEQSARFLESMIPVP